MSRIAFFNVPASGHLGPCLPIVKALVNAGHTVDFYSYPSAKEKVQNTGANFQLLPDPSGRLEEILTATPPPSFPLLSCSLLETSLAVLPDLIRIFQADPPDTIVSDTFCPWGYILARILHIRSVVLHATFAFHPSFIPPFSILLLALFDKTSGKREIFRSNAKFHQLSKLIDRSYGISFNSIWDITFADANNYTAANSHLVFIPKEFQYFPERFGPAYHFIGSTVKSPAPANNDPLTPPAPANNDPLTPPPAADSTKTEHPLIYVSFGSVTEGTRHFQNCIAAFADEPYRVIMSIAKTDPEHLGRIPANFIVKASVDQLAVLNDADVFITHGGMNSVSEATMHTVPMLLFPKSPEQELVAKKLRYFEGGILLKRSGKSQIRRAVAALLHDGSYKKAMIKLRDLHHAAGGIPAAVDIISTPGVAGAETVYPDRVILFDGICNLCNGAVQFVLKRDKKKKFTFAPLQSNTGQALLKKFGLPSDDFDSFVLITGNRYFLRSSAVLRVLKELGAPAKWMYGLIVFPRPLRDFVYRIVAKTRYGIFGQRSACMIPTADISERFLE